MSNPDLWSQVSVFYFQCARARVNGGIAKPNWARREMKMAIDQGREPDLRWDREGNLPPPPLPPPAEAPPQEEQQQAPQDEQQPLCAAAVMMHGPPPTMRQSGYRPSSACPTVFEGQEWTEHPQEAEPLTWPEPGFHVSANLESRHPVQSILTWSNSFLPASCDVHAVPEHSRLYGYSNPSSSQCSRPSRRSQPREYCSTPTLLGEVAVGDEYSKVMVE